MKRLSAVLLVSVLMLCSVFAQKVEIAASYPFDKPFGYWTEWEPNEGYKPHFDIQFISKDNEFFLWSPKDSSWYQLFLDGTSKLVYPGINSMNTDPFYYSDRNGYVMGYKNTYYDEWNIRALITDKNRTRDMEIPFKGTGYMYRTGNIVFFGMNTIEFLPDGSYKVRDVSETKAWLEAGKGEELGWGELILNNKVYGHTFGEIILGLSSESYKFTVQNHLKPMSDKYVDITNMNQTEYVLFGKDSKGLMYYRDFPSGNDNVNIEFVIAVLDPFTQEVYFYEDYGTCLWTPPKTPYGKIIGSYSWTVAPDGNIYFTDADVEKGEYQIKRVINRWWDDMGINDRIIGQMNTNHIPLLTAMNGKENDGYCFENDFVWVTEQSKDKKWSKIKKIDGREGWVETKYIDINTMVPVTNASLGIKIDQSPASTPASTTPTAKILKAADNLRLRKTELTSSEVITTMLKGTPVKIVATGRQETIDGITGNWVQVEVQSGGKDRNGSPIPAGTTGWCFGGYLE